MRITTAKILLRLTIIYIFIVNTGYISAQNTFGSIHSNYCPTNGVILNPSSMANAKTFLDINIIGFGSYINNNFIYVKDISIMQVLASSNPINIGYDARQQKTRLYNRNFVTGPGATWNKGDHGIGLAINGRSYSGIQNLPAFARPFIENGVKTNVTHHGIEYNGKNIRMSSLNFAEIQASYCYTFFKHGSQMMVGGLSVKKLYSIAGGAANVYNIDANVKDTSLISMYNLNADAMYTPTPKLNKKGGLGLDLGFTYQKMLGQCDSYLPHSVKNGCRYMPYKYKIGVSIIDIGSVKFQQQEVQYAGYDINNYEWDNYSNTKTSDNNVLDVFSTQESDINNGRVKKTNKIKLPTFISLQFDYNLWKSYIYVNGTIIQGIPHRSSTFGIRHANSLSISSRIETKWLDFSIPFSLYEYRYPQLGLSLRLGPITIGSDKFLNWIINTDLYGGDIYFYAKIPIFYHPKCTDTMRKSKKRFSFRKGSNCPILQ